MPRNIDNQALYNMAAVILIATMISLTGCATMRLNADSEESFAPDWGSGLGTPPANSELTGLSEESRQVERNLGYQ